MMGYLADTHLMLWSIDGSEKLPAIAKEMMCEGEQVCAKLAGRVRRGGLNASLNRAWV